MSIKQLYFIKQKAIGVLSLIIALLIACFHEPDFGMGVIIFLAIGLLLVFSRKPVLMLKECDYFDDEGDI